MNEKCTNFLCKHVGTPVIDSSNQISVSEISRFFDLENARLKMDDLEISRDLEIGQLTY